MFFCVRTVSINDIDCKESRLRAAFLFVDNGFRMDRRGDVFAADISDVISNAKHSRINTCSFDFVRKILVFLVFISIAIG